jgi:glycine oxidase
VKYDIAIIGGGIIGLSLAYELSSHGQRVALVDKDNAGQASWAAAGMLPPADLHAAPDPYEALRAFSRMTLQRWCETLCQQTGIDPEFRTCGAIHLARTSGELAALAANVAQWRKEGITANQVALDQLAALEPALRQVIQTGAVLAAYHLPDEALVRPPRLLKALRAASAAQGTEFIAAHFEAWEVDDDRVSRARTDLGWLEADRFCIAAGAWSQAIARALGMPIEIQPWRGQILLLSCQRKPLSRIIYEGPNYIVPRDDGHVLVGSTMEEVGLESSTTETAKGLLRKLAHDLVPALREAREEACWAGLRPGTPDGKPYLGTSAVAQNVFLATGHFRSGIALAAGTAVVMRQLLQGQPTAVDVHEFRPDR